MFLYMVRLVYPDTFMDDETIDQMDQTLEGCHVLYSSLAKAKKAAQKELDSMIREENDNLEEGEELIQPIRLKWKPVGRNTWGASPDNYDISFRITKSRVVED